MTGSLRGKTIFFIALLLTTVFAVTGSAFAWSCSTHMFIANGAGLARSAAVCFPDLTRKDNDALLGPLHWHNPAPTAVITPEYIDRFTIKPVPFTRQGASSPVMIRLPDPSGVLYFRICELYESMKKAAGWEREYYATVMAHYVGDLSQPLHNFPYGTGPAADGQSYPEEGLWAKKVHLEFDGVLDLHPPFKEVGDTAILATAVTPAIGSTDDLKREVAKVANASLRLANTCYREKRILTRKEALTQAALSIALVKGILAGIGPR